MGQTKKTRYRGQNVGFVFQAYNLLPTLTALENVSVPLLILGVARKEAQERAKDILEQVDLLIECWPLLRSSPGGSSREWPSPAR